RGAVIGASSSRGWRRSSQPGRICKNKTLDAATSRVGWQRVSPPADDRSGQLCTPQVLSTPVSPNASVSTMQIVQVPPASPDSPGTARLVKLKLQAPAGN